MRVLITILVLGSFAVADEPRQRDPKSKDNWPLTKADVVGVMSSVKDQAVACYKTHGVAGLVEIELVVGPNGQVVSSRAFKPFAGTPTGRCVEDAVKTAVFPAWTGKPGNVNLVYPFMLR